MGGCREFFGATFDIGPGIRASGLRWGRWAVWLRKKWSKGEQNRAFIDGNVYFLFENVQKSAKNVRFFATYYFGRN